MEKAYKASLLWKTLAFWGVFMALYVAFKLFPVFPLSLICGVNESNFQHYKAGFFSYLIVNLVEYGVNRHRIANQESFVFSRLTATVFLPWGIFLLWYLAPATIVRWPNNVLEILYANVIVILVGVCMITLESGLEQAAYHKPQKIVLITLFLASILLYVVFTYRLPWADVFVEPAWR
jgi:hypothetical protein